MCMSASHPFIRDKYYTGKHSYHSRKSCANYGLRIRDKESLIAISRTDLSPCQKCDPAEKPVEYAVCDECDWMSPVDECEREKGYKGACPACGSAYTRSAFISDDEKLIC